MRKRKNGRKMGEYKTTRFIFFYFPILYNEKEDKNSYTYIIQKEKTMTIIIPEHPTGVIHEIDTKNIRTLDVKRKRADAYSIEVVKKCGDVDGFETSNIPSVKALLSAMCGNETLVTI